MLKNWMGIFFYIGKASGQVCIMFQIMITPVGLAIPTSSLLPEVKEADVEVGKLVDTNQEETDQTEFQEDENTKPCPGETVSVDQPSEHAESSTGQLLT